MGRTIVWDLRVDWGLTGSYTDESDYLISASGSLNLAAPESSITSPRGTVDRCTLTLDNSTGRYSPMNTTGPLYAFIQNGKAYHAPMYLRVSVDGGNTYHRVFTGVIKLPREAGPTWQENATATIDCRSRDEVLLAKRVSTTNAQFAVAFNNSWTEETIIRQWLSDAGLAEGSDFILDPGLFVIPWAWLDDESPLEEIWQLAAACGGRFYADPDGVFRYENAAHWLTSPHTTSQETLDKGDYQGFEPYYDDRELYKAVTVEVSERSLSAQGTIWQADDVIVVPANSSKTVTAKLRQPAYSVDSVSYAAVTGGGRNIDSDVSITMTKYAQRVDLAITNANATYAANLVALSLAGVPVDGRPGGEVTATSSDSFWTNRQGRTRAIRQNAYVQTRGQAQFLADFLRDRYQTPRLSYQIRGAVGQPQRRLGDRITLSNDVMTSNRDAFITGIDWRLSDRGFVQDLTAIDAANLYPDTDVFVIDTDVLGGTKKVFY